MNVGITRKVVFISGFSCIFYRARICKQLRSTGIDSKESIPPGYVACRAGGRFLGLLKGLQIRALYCGSSPSFCACGRFPTKSKVVFISGFSCIFYRARICKRIRSPGIDSKESFQPGYVACRAGSLFLGSLKGLQIRARASPKIIYHTEDNR